MTSVANGINGLHSVEGSISCESTQLGWRFGGLRTQEPLHLIWDCVDWENKRLTVKDVKRRQERIIPLWPRVEISLLALFALAVDG